MRSILFIGSDTNRCNTLGKVFETFSETSCSVVTSARDTVVHMEQNGVDTVLVDLTCKAEQVHIAVNFILDRYPIVYLIFLRGSSVEQQDRHMLAQGHGSFRFPRNSSELQRMIYRMDKQYPIPPIALQKALKKEDVLDLSVDVEEQHDEHPVVTFLEEVERTISPTMVIREIQHRRTLKQILLTRINSPFYGIPSQITSVDRAVRLLGVQGVFNLFEESMETVQVA